MSTATIPGVHLPIRSSWWPDGKVSFANARKMTQHLAKKKQPVKRRAQAKEALAKKQQAEQMKVVRKIALAEVRRLRRIAVLEQKKKQIESDLEALLAVAGSSRAKKAAADKK